MSRKRNQTAPATPAAPQPAAPAKQKPATKCKAREVGHRSCNCGGPHCGAQILEP